jgi:ATP-dependent DNA helicase RecG
VPSEPRTDDPLPVGLEQLPGLTPARRDLLARLGLHTVGDLLLHFPRAYEDLTDVRPITALTADGELQTVRGEVVELEGRSLPDGRCVVSVVISDDGKHVLEGAWFNQSLAARRFRYGQWVAFSGKPKWYRGHWQMATPRVQILDGPGGDVGPGIVPVYPLTEDLRPEHLRAAVTTALERYAGRFEDVLAPELRERHGWPLAAKALCDVHRPASLEAAELGRQRFVYEEFLVLQLALALRRRGLRDREQAPVLKTTPAIDARIRRLFPFQLTPDQDRAVAEVRTDLASGRPMQRLLQADVGAGKTAVAAYALLVAVANKYQAALMAPTEVLARQHDRTLAHYLAGSRVRRLLLTGSIGARERREALDALAAGAIDLVVGTQALAQSDVRFARLGLVVIDEQHKFGVHQRATVRRLGPDPHYLVMTATPIPRTVALSVFGDLDVTVLRGLPPGRQPVRTRRVHEAGREAIYEQLRRGFRAGRQGFVVCPTVEGSAADEEVKAATKAFEELRTGPFREARVGLLHGRLGEVEKVAVMDDFRAGRVDLLVCTSVVEVGVDVPNATMLLVEHAERFGLSQLHQLRGRVSRGAVAGECFLFGEPTTEEGEERLRTVARTADGFALAEEDLRLRGGGELFGARQHGAGGLRFGSLIADAELLGKARKDAFALVAEDSGLKNPEHAGLRAAVERRYGATLELAEIG